MYNIWPGQPLKKVTCQNPEERPEKTNQHEFYRIGICVPGKYGLCPDCKAMHERDRDTIDNRRT